MMKHGYVLFAVAAVMSACGGGDDGYDASGVFEATEVTVSAQGSGELMRFEAEEGQTLEAGAVVGYIDTVQLHWRKVQLEASLKASGSRLYDVDRQIASLRQQIATQRKERNRFASLVKADAANRKQLDDIDGQILYLEKRLSAEREKLLSGNSSVSGEVQSLEARVALAEDQIRKNILVSPIRGTVLAKYAERGELASPGRALFKIADMEKVYLRAYVTAGQLTRLKLGQTVKVYADWDEDGRKEYSGAVTWISDQAEFTPKTIQTRDERANLVYAVKIAVKNDGYIKRGMYGEIKLD